VDALLKELKNLIKELKPISHERRAKLLNVALRIEQLYDMEMDELTFSRSDDR